MSQAPLLASLFLSSCLTSGLANAALWDAYIATHHLNGVLVLTVAIAGDCANDALWFWFGRLLSLQPLVKRIAPRLSPERRDRVAAVYGRVQGELATNDLSFILLIKSPLGTITAGPCISSLGALRYPYPRFFLIGAPMTIVWVLVYFGPFVFYSSDLLHSMPYLHIAISVAAVAVPLSLFGYTNRSRIQSLLLRLRRARESSSS